jgi:hypothetical protein
MKRSIRSVVLGGALLTSASLLSGCISVTDPGYRNHYPPAYPSPGYRYAYPGGPSLYWDSGLGLYTVVGHPDYYWNDGYFYRWSSGYWARSRNWDRGWARCQPRYLPRRVYYVNDHYYARNRRPPYGWYDNDYRRKNGSLGDRLEDAARREQYQNDRDRHDGHDGDWDHRDGRDDGRHGWPNQSQNDDRNQNGHANGLGDRLEQAAARDNALAAQAERERAFRAQREQAEQARRVERARQAEQARQVEQGRHIEQQARQAERRERAEARPQQQPPQQKQQGNSQKDEHDRSLRERLERANGSDDSQPQ